MGFAPGRWLMGWCFWKGRGVVSWVGEAHSLVVVPAADSDWWAYYLG